MFSSVVNECGDAFGVDFIFDDVADLIEIIGHVVGVGECNEVFDLFLRITKLFIPFLEEFFGGFFVKVIIE